MADAEARGIEVPSRATRGDLLELLATDIDNSGAGDGAGNGAGNGNGNE